MTVPTRILGNTGQNVTILGLGGEGVLRTFGQDRNAYALINRALDLGINYCESARAYSGSESYYGKALKERLLDVTPVIAELQHLATDLACSVLHTDGMLPLLDHTGDLPTFWIAAADLAPREGKRVPSRISFEPPRDRAP